MTNETSSTKLTDAEANWRVGCRLRLVGGRARWIRCRAHFANIPAHPTGSRAAMLHEVTHRKRNIAAATTQVQRPLSSPSA